MNLETLHKYQSDGLLYFQTHPTLPLTIWNYTEKVQYQGLWDEVTLQCRGLVTDDKGNVVARPFRKFFNIEEGKHTPTSEFEVYEKMDGSLGIVFMYGGEWILATRGSFTSDQSVKGRELLNKYDLNLLSPGYTYLFEIIYSDNRIVCNYDYEDVVMLGCIEITDGCEVDVHDAYYTDNFNVVKRYNGISDYSTLKGMVKDNHEGFVVRFSNGDRMKVKGEEYIRLHKIMTNLRTITVWETLSSGGKLEDLLANVPDEYYQQIKIYADHLQEEFNLLESSASLVYDLICSHMVDITSSKEFAFHAKAYSFHSVLFAMRNGKDYKRVIWKLIKPKSEKL